MLGRVEWSPGLGPHPGHYLVRGCGRPGSLPPPGRAGLESQGRALSLCVPAAAECKVAAFFFFFPLELSGVSEMSQKGLGQLGEGGGFWDRKGREISLRG